ncbi:hypothetical protein AB0K43_10885 [Kitasatospora sp. NPDC049258]|uniref:hypothetical protein n=1 Tax=Kitasatospora sp. NPDC049258 TaxID=3155394 RepID=UPI0034343CF6
MDLPGRPGVIRIYDHSRDPRPLLRLLAEPLRRLKAEQWVPLVHVRRGWLGGSHLQVVLRPLQSNTLRPDGFAALAAELAGALPAAPPDEAAYQARAAELGRWENVEPPFPPVRPQGHVEVSDQDPHPGWAPALVQARDQLSAHLLEPVLGSAALEGTDVLRHLARVLALLARSHPYGVGVGTLPYRSHVEGVMSAVGARTDLRTVFRSRYAQDAGFFAAAVTGERPEDEAAVLDAWRLGFARCWGAAEAMTAAGLVDEAVLAAVGAVTAPTDDRPVPSPFHSAAHHSGLTAQEPYWQIAHRLVLNTLYTALTCFGISPLQRYYLCFGLSEAADELLGESWLERLAGFADRELPDHVRTAAEATSGR